MFNWRATLTHTLWLLLLAAALLVQIGLALRVDKAITDVWSGTASPWRILPHLVLAAVLTFAVMVALHLRDATRRNIWRQWRWFGLFWGLALLVTCSVGG